MTEKTQLTTILVIKTPEGKVLQVAGDAGDIDSLITLLKQIPQENRGDGWIHDIIDDCVLGIIQFQLD